LPLPWESAQPKRALRGLTADPAGPGMVSGHRRASAMVTCRAGRGVSLLAAGCRAAGRLPVQPTKTTVPASAQANRKHIRRDISIIPFGTHPDAADDRGPDTQANAVTPHRTAAASCSTPGPRAADNPARQATKRAWQAAKQTRQGLAAPGMRARYPLHSRHGPKPGSPPVSGMGNGPHRCSDPARGFHPTARPGAPGS